MKISYDWLNTFFDDTLPSAEEVAHALTFHSWEVEDTEEKDGDTIFDVKVLPDKAAWALSHRGVAKDLSVSLGIPLVRDPIREATVLEPRTGAVVIDIETDKCRRYAVALIRGVKVASSPEWLQKRLRAIGQKPINNIVDAANYVMFDMGQPLHAFDAGKLENGANGEYSIFIRPAQEGERIVTLASEEHQLSGGDILITDGRTEPDTPIGIAGIKGGKCAEVDEKTTDVIIESANFDPVSVRKTSQRIRVRTDASVRFENGIVPEMAEFGLAEAVHMIIELAGGECTSYSDSFPSPSKQVPVSVALTKINNVLGLSLSQSDIRGILERFGYVHEITSEMIAVVPPIDRNDLVIQEDLIEEIGRMHGYEHVVAAPPPPALLKEINKRFYYTEKLREALTALGFSEILTSSFRSDDAVKLQNAFASDKGYLRGDLRKNMEEALSKNAPNADLLGVKEIRIFEIGTVFHRGGERTLLSIGVRSPGGYKEKTDGPIMERALKAVAEVLAADLPDSSSKDGIIEIDIEAYVKSLPTPKAYEHREKSSDVLYKPFSTYPFVSRDIALWVPSKTPASEVEDVIRNAAGDLLESAALFDSFEKEERVSHAFRLVFQSSERTLTDEEVNAVMANISECAGERGWNVR